MGCDIHLHVEIKVKGEWLHYSHPSINRDYELFGQMAGVRGDGPPIVEPRGFPPDANAMTRLDYEWGNADWHTASWLVARELRRLETWMVHQPGADGLTFGDAFGFLFGNSYGGWGTRKGKNYPPWIEDFRFVFWFDC